MIFGIVEGFKNFIRSKFTGFISILSMIFALSLISLLMIIFYNTRINIKVFENKTSIQVYFPEDYKESKNREIEAKIKVFPETQNVTFITRDEGLKEFLAAQNISESDTKLILKTNPLPDMMDIDISSRNLSSETIIAYTEKIKAIDPNLDIKYELSFFEAVKKIAKTLFQILIALTLFVTIISMMLIFNTIRLSIHGRKLSILTMKLVGAKNFLIRIPFIFESIYQSLLAFLIVYFSSYYLLEFLNNNFEFTKYLYHELQVYRYHYHILAITAFTIAVLGSFFSVRKYLKLSFKT